MADAVPGIDVRLLSSYAAWASKWNRDPILDIFKQLFPPSGEVLELGSGNGAHINYFAPHFPHTRFQPSECDRDLFPAIRQAQIDNANANVWDPILIDLTEPGTWPAANKRYYDVIVAINLLDTAPAAIADGALRLTARLLKDGGFLAIYGPFKAGSGQAAPSSRKFGNALGRPDVPGWGLKDVGEIEKAAAAHGIVPKQRFEVPANHFMLIFGRS